MLIRLTKEYLFARPGLGRLLFAAIHDKKSDCDVDYSIREQCWYVSRKLDSLHAEPSSEE